MHSYRHGFHAANHADVLKHAVFVHILDYFNKKDTPYRVIDTHAGAGVYDLHNEWATHSNEAAQGGLKLAGQAGDTPSLIQRYLEATGLQQSGAPARSYPGSPWLALDALRPGDQLHLFETHPTEIEVLDGNLRRRRGIPARQVSLHASDGFDGIKGLLPPPSRRGIVIIDPSYEDKNDYKRLPKALEEGLKRFATGCYAIWHPLVQRREADNLVRSLQKLPDCEWLHATLSVSAPSPDGFGMHGSGMFIINPPWTLRQALADALPWMARQLGQDAKAGYTLRGSEEMRAKGHSAAERKPAAPGGAQRRPAGAGNQKKRSPSFR